MPKKKLSAEPLVALVEKLIAQEPHEFKGFLWAARPQSDYWEALGVSKWTVLDRIKKPPFIRRRATIYGKQVCLLRLGEAAPKDADDYKRIMLSMWRDWRDKQGLLSGTAAQDAAAAKAAETAAKEGEDAQQAAKKARAKVAADERREGQCLWGFANDIIDLSAELALTKDFEERLVAGAFKHALMEWPYVASAIKLAMEALPDGKVRFYDYPSITVIRRFWKSVVYAFVQDLQKSGKVSTSEVNQAAKILATTDPFDGHPGMIEEKNATKNAVGPAMIEMMQAKWALKAEGKPPSVAGMVELMKAKYPGYALVKALEEAKASSNLELAAKLSSEIELKFLSEVDGAEAALEAQAAWEAKVQADSIG